MSRDVQSALAAYYLIGLAWLAIGIFMPRSLGGWLRWWGDPFMLLVYVVAGAAVWPLILGRIVWRMVRHGEENIDL